MFCKEGSMRWREEILSATCKRRYIASGTQKKNKSYKKNYSPKKYLEISMAIEIINAYICKIE